MLLNEIFSEDKLSVERVYLNKGENLSFEPSLGELWILRKGTVSIFRGKAQKKILQFGQVFFLPPGESCILISEQTCLFIRLLIPDSLALCEKFFFPGLIEEKRAFSSSFNPVEMTPLLWEYTRHLSVLFNECTLTHSLLRMKILELFHLLTYSYSKRDLAGLFYPVLKREDSFARFIEENYPRLKTAKELAQEAHMSLKSFENKFNYVFGTSPGRWMIRRKTEIVYQEITSSSLPLSIIADKCGFATLSHMTDFCKKHLGTTPSQIRKRSEL